MSKRNRVTPVGEIIAVPARGTLMGNRGCLHDERGQITRSSARKAWVTCLLDFNGRKRTVMTPGKYTELFFLDEATAFAAGHRPCGTCQKIRYDEFKRQWAHANPEVGNDVQAMDQRLHQERLASGGSSALWRARLADLPDGAFVTSESEPVTALLYFQKVLYAWTPLGYETSRDTAPIEWVKVVTPRSICRVLASGFKAAIHDSAGSLSGTSRFS